MGYIQDEFTGEYQDDLGNWHDSIEDIKDSERIKFDDEYESLFI